MKTTLRTLRLHLAALALCLGFHTADNIAFAQGASCLNNNFSQAHRKTGYFGVSCGPTTAVTWGSPYNLLLNINELLSCGNLTKDAVQMSLSLSFYIMDRAGHKQYIFTNSVVNDGSANFANDSHFSNFNEYFTGTMPAAPPSCFLDGTITMGADLVVTKAYDDCMYANTQITFYFFDSNGIEQTGIRTGTPNPNSPNDQTVFTHTLTGIFACTFQNSIPPFTTFSTSTEATCGGSDGTATINAGGTPPFTYQWATTPVQTTQTATNLAAGDYQYTVTENGGCIAINTAKVVSGHANGTYVNATTLSGTNNLWSQNMTIKGQTIIPAGALLTINNSAVINFYDNASGITIQPNGTLVVSTATLTNNPCAGVPTELQESWQGITAIALPAGGQGLPTSGIATIQMSNATISNALMGIFYDKQKSSLAVQRPYIPTTNKAISLDHVNFINNHEGCINGITETIGSGPYFLVSGLPVEANYCDFSTIYTGRLVQLDNEYYVSLANDNFHKGTGTASSVNLRGVYSSTIYNTTITNSHFYDLNQAVFSESSFGPAYGHTLTLASCTFDNVYDSYSQAVACVEFNNPVPNTPGTFTFGTTSITNNVFNSIPKGVYLQGGDNDLLSSNTFNTIPAGDAYGAHTFGVFVEGCQNIDIEQNSFTGPGYPSQSLRAAASHAIIVDNSGSSALIFLNPMITNLDYGIHTEGDNSGLRIRCNAFGAGYNGELYASAWYTPAPALLRQQGQPDCQPPVPGGPGGIPADAAGNTWVATSVAFENSNFPDFDMDIDQSATFDYYANHLDQNRLSTTQPHYNNTSPQWLGNGHLNINCANATPTSCSTFTKMAGTPPLPHGGGTGCTTTVQELQATISSLLAQRTVIQTTIDNTVSLLGNLLPQNNTLVQLEKQADEMAKQALDVTNVLTTTVINCPGTTTVKQVLQQSQLIAPKRTLAGINLNEGNVADLRSTLNTITQMNNSLAWNNVKEKAAMQADNQAFVTYMSVLADALAQHRTILSLNKGQYTTQLTTAELATVRTVANAKLPTSAMAQSLLTDITGERFPHPISKTNVHNGGARKAPAPKAANTTAAEFNLYPNPNNGNMTLNYSLQTGDNGLFELMDITGRVVYSSKLAVDNTTLAIQADNLKNGIYFYRIHVNGSILAKDKMVVLH